MSYKKSKRRSFALLEVMIGLTILCSLSVYLIKAPFSSLKKEIQTLYQIEANRLWEAKVLEIEANVKERVHTLKHLISEASYEKIEIPLFLSDKLEKPVLKKHYRLFIKKEGETIHGKPCFLIALQMKKEKKPTHLFFIS